MHIGPKRNDTPADLRFSMKNAFLTHPKVWLLQGLPSMQQVRRDTHSFMQWFL